MRTTVHNLDKEKVRAIMEALREPGATKGDACLAVGIPPAATQTLDRALDRLGLEIALTVRRKRTAKLEGGIPR